MDDAAMRRLVADARVGRLATVTSTGSPHVVPCCHATAPDGGAIYSAVDGKPKSTAALKRLDNIRANPATTLVVDHYDDGDWSRLWWVRVDGRATVLDDRVASTDEIELALDLLAAKYEQYRTDRPAGAVLRIEPERWVGWSAS